MRDEGRRQEAILGFDIGGTKTSVVVGTYDGKILHRISFPTTTHKGFELSFSTICTNASKALRWAKRRRLPVGVISVSVGGPLDIEKGIIYSPPNLPGWDGIQLKELLEGRFSLPVFIEHDGNAGALAEFFFGAGRGHKNIVFLTLGTGLGAGIILDGKIYHGTNDNAGEVGHIRIARVGPEAYGKKGSWEGYCSGGGMSKLAHQMNPRRWNVNVTAYDISRAARRGNRDALKVIQKSAKFLGQGLAILMDILNPELIILGSLGFRLGDLLIEPALKEMEREATPRAFAACEVVPAALGESIGDLASLAAAIYHKRSSHGLLSPRG
ncbi:MAG: ROK family protein [Bacteroidota bacterium]